MEKKLLIFDLDGTLVDSRADLTTGVNLMRAHYGLSPLSVDTVTGYVGDGIRKLVERSLEGADVDFEEALALNRGFYAEHMLDQTDFYPHAGEGLQALAAAGHRLAVLSNKPGDATRRLVEHLGVSGCFLRVLGGGDLPELKPSPAGIRLLLDETGMAPEDCWMIGDHHTDLEAAHSAGVNSGFVTYGIGFPGEFDADQTWHGFEGLVDYFLP